MAGNARRRAGDPPTAVAFDSNYSAAKNGGSTANGQDYATDPVYRPRSIKRFRRTKAVIGDVRDAIHEVLTEANPQTVRQVFYALTVRGVVKKAESEYKRTVIRLLTETAAKRWR